MQSLYRIQLYWHGRDEGLEAIANRLSQLIANVGAGYRELQGWSYLDKEGTARPLTGRSESQSALECRAVDWEVAARKLRSYQPLLRLDGSPSDEIELAAGIPRLEPAGAFMPNRLRWQLTQHDAYGHVDGMRFLFNTAIAAFEADFGYVGTPTTPTEVLPLFSTGVPPVGWMTYLSRAYGPLPPLPKGALEHPLAGGSVVVAMPELFDDYDDEHRSRLEALRRTLADAGVLESSAQVAG
ncbi:MAG: Imm52 family immunity protein [Polyangiaceae bacterium]